MVINCIDDGLYCCKGISIPCYINNESTITSVICTDGKRIIYGNEFLSLPPLIQKCLFDHEIGHIKLHYSYYLDKGAILSLDDIGHQTSIIINDSRTDHEKIYYDSMNLDLLRPEFIEYRKKLLSYCKQNDLLAVCDSAEIEADFFSAKINGVFNMLNSLQYLYTRKRSRRSVIKYRMKILKTIFNDDSIKSYWD